MNDQPKYKAIDMTCRMGAPENPAFENAQGWTVSLEYKAGSKWGAMELPFYMGTAHGQTPPDLETVLDCILRDDPQGMSFDEWIADYWGACDAATWDEWKFRKRGYDESVRNAASLRTLLGDDFEAIRAEIEGLEL